MTLPTPDPGRYFVSLATDFSSGLTEAASGGEVTDFGFTPEPDTRYYIEGVLAVQITDPNPGTNSLIGPRPGIQWPTGGVLDSACYWYGSGLYIGPTTHHCEGQLLTTNRTLQLTGISNVDYSYPVILRAWLETGPVVVGGFQIILFTENATEDAILKAGSFLAIYSGHDNQ